MVLIKAHGTDAAGGPFVTSFACVMYQKVISADPEILTRNFLQEREIAGRKNGRASTRIAWITDTLLFRVPPLRALSRRRNRKSIRAPSGTTDVDAIRGKTARRRETNGHNDRTIQLLRAHRRRSPIIFICAKCPRGQHFHAVRHRQSVELTAILALLLHQRPSRSRKITMTEKTR